MKNLIFKILEENELKYQIIIDDKNRIVSNFSFGLANGKVDTYVEIQHRNKNILIFTVCPITIPKDRRNSLSEFITRINNGIFIGNFELNMESGNLKYKASYLFNEINSGSEDIFLQNLLASFRMMDRYLPGFMSLIYTEVSPIDAINKIENNPNPILN